jgi:hypothetical protein
VRRPLTLPAGEGAERDGPRQAEAVPVPLELTALEQELVQHLRAGQAAGGRVAGRSSQRPVHRQPDQRRRSGPQCAAERTSSALWSVVWYTLKMYSTRVSRAYVLMRPWCAPSSLLS